MLLKVNGVNSHVQGVCRYFKGLVRLLGRQFGVLQSLLCVIGFCFISYHLTSRISSMLTTRGPRENQAVQGHKHEKREPVLCQFPNLDPFDPKIIKFFTKHPTLNCDGNSPNIVDLVGDELRVDLVKVQNELDLESIDGCRYRDLRMAPGNDFAVDYTKWSPLFHRIRVRPWDEFLQIKCFLGESVVATSYKALIRKKKDVEVIRMQDYRKHVALNSPKETMSVLLVGVDGMSRANVIRCMPKTKRFILEHLNAIEFHNYNKVGYNTNPNIFGLLTGKRFEEVPNWNPKMPFDILKPLFLWNQYEKSGYRSAVMFDTAFMSIFHYIREGWNEPPADYTFRPIVLVSEFDEDNYRKTDKNCMGDTAEVTHLLDYWVQLSSLFNNTVTTPYFAYSFLTRLSHDDENKACAGDELYLEFFQRLKNSKSLNNTVLLFFSDHGPRFGEGRYTYNKVFESKAPMLFAMFPPWFEKKYPQVMDNFKENRHRLVTTFDLHETFKDLLKFTGQAKPFSPTSRGISLFSPIPSNRTCQVADIPFDCCACSRVSRKNLASTKLGIYLAKKLLRRITHITNKHRDKCAVLKLKEIKGVYVISPEENFEEDLEYYQLTIQTKPGDGLFEASVFHHNESGTVRVMGDISRVNMYRGQAECVASTFLRSFCYCKEKPVMEGFTIIGMH